MANIQVTVGNNVSRQTKIYNSETPLRTVLEDAQIDYARGGVHLDGSPVQAGGLDKTFADYGITDRCFLLSVVKCDNAAKMSVIGGAVVITSALNLSDIELVEKYRPSALALMGGENNKDELYRIGTARTPYGDIDKLGATFGAANADGKAIITELYAPVSDDVKSELADKYGAAMTNLGKLEEILPGVVEEIKAEREALITAIEVQ